MLARQCFQSKCSETNCCFGLLVIKRDTKAEEEIEEYKIDHNIISDGGQQQQINVTRNIQSKNNASSRNPSVVQPQNMDV